MLRRMFLMFFLSMFLFSVARGQTAEQLLEHADSLYNRQQYGSAKTVAGQALLMAIKKGDAEIQGKF